MLVATLCKGCIHDGKDTCPVVRGNQTKCVGPKRWKKKLVNWGKR